MELKFRTRAEQRENRRTKAREYLSGLIYGKDKDQLTVGEAMAIDAEFQRQRARLVETIKSNEIIIDQQATEIAKILNGE